MRWAVGAALLLGGGAGGARADDERAPDQGPTPDAVVETPPSTEPPPADEDDEDDADGPTDDAPAPAEASPEPVRRGLQVQGAFGLGDCSGGVCSSGDEGRFSNSRLGLGFEVSGWYRPMPLFSVGGRGHYSLIGLHDRERVDNSADYFSFEVGGRFHPLQQGPIDAFAGLTVGYFVYGVASDYTALDIQQTETTNALVLALEVGGEYYLAPRMSLGALLRFTIPSWLEQCYDTELGHDCDAISDLPPSLQDDFPSVIWYLGGTFSYHLGG